MSLRIAIVGCGAAGQRRGRALRGLGVDHVAVVDQDAAQARRLAEEIGAQVVDSVSTAAALADAVLVCTPLASRSAIGCAAAREGVHLFVESPVADSVDGAGSLVEEMARSRQVLMVGSYTRFHPALDRIRTLLEARTVGRAYAAAVWLGGAGGTFGWNEDVRGRNGTAHGRSGPLGDVQWFDAVRWLFGNPIEVSAMCANVFPQGRDGEEFSAALVRMESGVVVQLCADPFRGYRGTRIEIVGTDGALQWAAADNRIAIQRLGGRERREEDVFVDEEELVGAELRHFLACVLTGRTPITDGAEGRAALTLALVVRRAVRLRRTIAVGDGSRRAGGRRGLPTLLRLVHAG